MAPEFTCIVPDYPDVSVQIPWNSVPADDDFCLTLKVNLLSVARVDSHYCYYSSSFFCTLCFNMGKCFVKLFLIINRLDVGDISVGSE